jgi:periodic tryptophan protein 1
LRRDCGRLEGSASSAAAAAPYADPLEQDPAFASLRGVEVPGEEEEEEDEMEGGDVVRGREMRGDEEEEEEDVEDVEAKAHDYFFLAGRTDDDVSCVELYSYDRSDGTLFVHHDISLPSVPLALAWLDCPPDEVATVAGCGGAGEGVGSFVAVGTFRPGIELWNLDVVDPLEPTLELGGVDEAAEDARPDSHVEAVMTLDWNRHQRNLLASGGADRLVKVWDVVAAGQGRREGASGCLTTLSHHRGKVQAVRWHPDGEDVSVLASASYDRTVAVLDVAAVPEGPVLRLPLDADPEDLQWSPHDGSLLVAALENGRVVAFDVRSPKEPLWTLRAHRGEASSLSFAPRARGVLATAGADRTMNVWDCSAAAGDDKPPVLLRSKPAGIGAIFSIRWMPHETGLLVAGGSSGQVLVWDVDGDDEDLAATLRARAADVDPERVAALLVRPRPDGQLL